MSTCTPCFPLADIIHSPRRRSVSSSFSSSTSTPRSYVPSQVSYSARLSRSHIALASVSEYIQRSPSPTSIAVDPKRVSHLRRKFRLAIDATYRDTSSGKWAHVSEMAKLGSTRGRWHGVCSGSNAPHSLYKSSKRNNQGAIDADPYPRPPVPVLDLRETRERVENWQANVLSAPLSQVDSGDPEQKNQSVPVEDDRRSPPLKFPTVKRRKDNVVKVMKRKQSPSGRENSTSRYFRGVVDPNLPENLKCDAQGAIRVASPPRGSNVELTPRSRKVALGMVPKIARTPSPPTPNTASIPENIHQVSEAFFPPSFPSQLQTSTPPPPPRLAKPPVIPLAEGLFLASLPSPPPFPRSQTANRDSGPESQPNGSPSPSARKRPFRSTPSPPPGSPSSRLSKRRFQSKKPGLSSNSTSQADSGDFGDTRQLDDPAVNPSPAFMANTPKHAPVIDLRQLAFSQRSGDQSPHRSRPTMTMMTSKTKEKGKSRAMTLDDASNKPAASPGRNFPPSLPPLSPTSLPPRSPTHAPSPPLQMETLSSPLNFPRCEDIQDIFVPAATSTQQPPPPLPKKGGHPPPPDTDLSQSSPFDTEALDLSAAVRVERDVDFAMWIREVPVVEEGEEGRGEERDDNAGTVVPRASQSAASTGPAEIAFGK